MSSSLTYEHDKLPSNVISLLETGKFVHLGTADTKGIPDVALMNYYYLPSHELYSKQGNETGPFSDSETSTDHTYIILSTSKSSLKYKNIEQNNNVSLLFHDWTTAKNIYRSNHKGESEKPAEAVPGSNLLQLLQSLNQSELSQVSATLTGSARIVQNSNELVYYKTKLSKENPDAKIYIDGDSNSIILVQITSAKVCDSQNHQAVYQ